MRVTGDIDLDDINLDDATIQNLTVTEAFNITNSGLSTFSGKADFNDSVDIEDNLIVSGITTITRLEATDVNVSGVVTAASFVGGGQIGVRSEGTFIGTGVTMVDFKSSNAQNTVDFDATAGIATVTVTTGVSLGLAIALGG